MDLLAAASTTPSSPFATYLTDPWGGFRQILSQLQRGRRPGDPSPARCSPTGICTWPPTRTWTAGTSSG